jgi:hypothetical protein
MRFTGLRPIERNGLKGFGFSIQFTDQSRGNGPALPVGTATEKQAACHTCKKAMAETEVAA